MRGYGASRVIATTMLRSTWAGVTSTFATTNTAEFWSPSWQPTRHELEKYTCRHGMGYSIIGSRIQGIEARTRYFVPLRREPRNLAADGDESPAEGATLSIFSTIEFCLWDAQDDSTNFQRNFNIGEVEIVDGVIYHKTEYRERRDHFAYFACSAKSAGFDTQRDTFLGSYRGWDNPAVVERGESANSIAHGWAPIGVATFEAEPQAGRDRSRSFSSSDIRKTQKMRSLIRPIRRPLIRSRRRQRSRNT